MFIRKVSGVSMCPYLKPGQIVLVSRSTKKMKKGDVIIFKHKGLEKIKRIESIEPGYVTVLGDNKNKSKDSRQFGPIQKKEILGRLVLKF